MFTVWFTAKPGGPVGSCVFMSDVPTRELAARIVENLIEEGFVEFAWIEKE